MDKYINLFTDFGFKKVFGEEPNKDLLISFLNTLLPAKHQIAELEYSRSEWQGVSAVDRKAIFDLHCKTPDGTYFIVELQKPSKTTSKIVASTTPASQFKNRAKKVCGIFGCKRCTPSAF